MCRKEGKREKTMDRRAIQVEIIGDARSLRVSLSALSHRDPPPGSLKGQARLLLPTMQAKIFGRTLLPRVSVAFK